MTRMEEFNTLSFRDKIRRLYEEGTFIVSIRYYGYKINLYLYDENYIEVFYNHKLDLIERIEPLQGNPTRMKFYSDQIKLPADFVA
ncbi:hypothetical protein [Fulvivirga sedimenti]|uniref:Uncharacterized protein n=1 Tax=Fulvivirga sedimenti TaxID=2879465 RepID=A0A9X1L1P3_9BACT|nr:hypothetical protein [Fulvivirga sedimenti]MCA6079024.1 hypothetical protein [Fulvivirga sedimenti]